MKNMMQAHDNEAIIEYVLRLENEIEKKQNEIEKREVEFKSEVEKREAEFKSEVEKREAEIQNRQSEIEQKQKKIELLEKECERMNNNYEQLRKMLFGQSSEKTRFIEDADQLSFLSHVLNEAEAFALQKGQEELTEITVPGHTRKKKRSRKELIESLPVIETLYEKSDDDMNCDACDGKTRYLGKEHIRDEINIVPAKMYINRISRKNYVCDSCHKDENQIRTIKSEVPEPVIKNSLASPSAAAGVIYQKYVNSVPLARQEKDWSYQGVHIGRATLGNWVIKAAREHLQPLYELMKETLLKAKIIAADETEVQVLKENGRLPQTKSKMWVYRSVGRETSASVVLFEYQPGRHGHYAANFLKGYSGILMTDGYTGYDAVSGVTRSYCFAHARRYWHKSLPKNPEGSNAKIGLDYCDKLFELEREWKELPHEERRKMRNSKAKPVLDKYFEWTESLNTLAGSGLGKAVEYSLNHKQGLMCYLTDGEIEISTNCVERNIRSFVIGRNNWIAIDTVAGAKASAVCYSIVITARENGLNPFEYLKYLFEELPKRRKNKDSQILENCLPWSKTLPEKCYMHKPYNNDNSEQLTLQ
jgi:transposase